MEGKDVAGAVLTVAARTGSAAGILKGCLIGVLLLLIMIVLIGPVIAFGPAANPDAGVEAPANPAVPVGGGAEGGPITGDAQALAQELVAALDDGRMYGILPDHTIEVRYIAAGQRIPDCGLDIGVLRVMVYVLHKFGSFGVSDLNRRCTGQLEGAGVYSAHYMYEFGRAVDFIAFGGVITTGADANAYALIRDLDTGVVPEVQRVGQLACRGAAITSTIEEFPDPICNHLHVDMGFI